MRVSKKAVKLGLSAQKVLEAILLARAFTYDQMIELCENRISQLENIKMLFVSGITGMFPNYEIHSFEELHRALNGIKNALHELEPLIILTAPSMKFRWSNQKEGTT